MITDEERREVARKLRAGAEYLPNDMYSDDLELELAKTVCEYDTPSVDVLFNRLADLIEPSMPSDPGEAGLASVYGFIREMRHSTKEEQDEYGAMLEKMSVEMHPVDRDALLALADECMDASRAYVGDGHGLTSKQFANVARRIREALGVQGQRERGRI